MCESYKTCEVKASHKIKCFSLYKLQKQAKLTNGVRSQDHDYLGGDEMGIFGGS